MSYISVLTEQQRAELLLELSKYMSDDDLISAVQEAKAWREKVKQDMSKLLKKAAEYQEKQKVTSNVYGPVARPPTVEELKDSSVLVGPKRINARTQASILRYLKDGPATPADINETIEGTLSKTAGILAVLAERKIIVKDGTKYKLPS
jgi:hypothetical protein